MGGDRAIEPLLGRPARPGGGVNVEPLSISSLSKPYVYSHIKGAAGTGTVEFAFVQAVEPSGGDWHAGSWGSATATGAWARALIGPGTDFELTNGTWQMWVRVTSSPEELVMHAGEVLIT
jgi:hypothetical protein